MKNDLLFILLLSAAPLFGQQKGPHPQKSIATIANEAKGAVVSIVMTDNKGQPIAQGSGFVVNSTGRIVTNYHVIKTGTSAVVKLPDGAFFTVDGLLAFDRDRDVAVIKANGEKFRALALGDSDRIRVGEAVVAIGSPLSLESTVSNGIVSGIRIDKEQKPTTVVEEVLLGDRKLLQITAPISPGSSGGPLFNMAGEVVGITTSHLQGGQNLNFAIPINDARRLLTGLASPTVIPFPNEAETVVATPQTTARTDQPSLEETQLWMKENINTWQSNVTQIFVDWGAGSWELMKCPNSADLSDCYISYTDLFVARLGDVHPQTWEVRSTIYELSFSGCSMTVDEFESTRTSRGSKPDPKAKEAIKYKYATAFDLGEFDPHVTVEEQVTNRDSCKVEVDPATGKYQCGGESIPRGMKFSNDFAVVSAMKASIHKSGLPRLDLDLSYPFAERFAKALSHAIALCGGKPESF